jgi:hypothetical protein
VTNFAHQGRASVFRALCPLGAAFGLAWAGLAASAPGAPPKASAAPSAGTAAPRAAATGPAASASAAAPSPYDEPAPAPAAAAAPSASAAVASTAAPSGAAAVEPPAARPTHDEEAKAPMVVAAEPSESLYEDPAWLQYFWSDPEQAAQEMPDDLRPVAVHDNVPMMLGGMVLSTVGTGALLTGVVLFVRQGVGNARCSGDYPTKECDEKMWPLVPLLTGVAALAAGIPLVVIGGTRHWEDPDGNAIPAAEEARRQQGPTVRLTVGAGALGAEGRF